MKREGTNSERSISPAAGWEGGRFGWAEKQGSKLQAFQPRD